MCRLAGLARLTAGQTPNPSQLGWQTSAFGRAVERLLLSYGKDVIEQQTLLRRIADISIELYALTAVLSRASRSVQQGSATAEHETKLCLAFATRVHRTIDNNLAALRYAPLSHPSSAHARTHSNAPFPRAPLPGQAATGSH